MGKTIWTGSVARARTPDQYGNDVGEGVWGSIEGERLKNMIAILVKVFGGGEAI